MDIASMLVGFGWIVAVILGSAFGSFMWKVFLDYGFVAKLERRVTSLENSIKGSRGASAREEKEERMSLAIAEGAALLQGGMTLQEAAKQLLPKYPDIAGKLAKEFMGGKLGL